MVRGGDYQFDTLVFWGWPLCTRTTYRFIEHYEKLPRFVRGLQKYTMVFKNGTKIPVIAAGFPKGDIRDLGLGCGYLSVADE